MKVEVLGAGSWGSALAILLARNGAETLLVARTEEEAESLIESRENLRYLPGFAFPENVRFSHLESSREQPELTILAVPSNAVRAVSSTLEAPAPLVLVAAKGLELGGAATLTETAKELLPNSVIGALSGPNLAVEIAQGVPTAAVVAFREPEVGEKARAALMCATFRVYLSDDVAGVELGGALKNVLAIGAGMSDGLGFGDNTKGALLSRGLQEMTRLGIALGARVDTFLGLAGAGDLFATASSKLSRNYRVGYALGKGETLQDAMTNIGQVAEGVTTSEAALVLARRALVTMPVFEAIENVLRGRTSPLQAVRALMERGPRNEGLS